MAATAVMPTFSTAGLHRAPTIEDLEISRAVYNTLPHPEDQPEISDAMLKSVGEIFVRHGAQSTFGIHLLHGHFTAPEGTALLGIQVPMTNTTQACWTKPVSVTELTSKSVHGHVFRGQADSSFIAYEFHEGEVSLKAEDIDLAFFRDFTDFLNRNGLANLLAFELLDGPQDHIEKEFQVGPQATVLFHEKDVIGLNSSTITTGGLSKSETTGSFPARVGRFIRPRKTHMGSSWTRNLFLLLRL
ncbi:hypothetical protein F4678DRAFT_424718 [Xylaria arbuscula]|nr:hypothetical protein F4678DRAFT_424718 [Xylaria arbuscula]